MERAARFAHDDTTQTKLDKLDAMLALAATSKQNAALFAEMLSLPNDGRYPAPELTPQQRRQKTLEALISQMEALSRFNPLLMIFEDAQWADPTSLEIFGRAIDEFEPSGVADGRVPAGIRAAVGWTPLRYSAHSQSAREREIAAMIDRVIGNKALPVAIRQDIIERTDGIPLFVEEMTKAVLEAESESDARQTAAAVPSSAVAVPASLHATLMARLDRLGSAKEVAQIGAAIGRESLTPYWQLWCASRSRIWDQRWTVW